MLEKRNIVILIPHTRELTLANA